MTFEDLYVIEYAGTSEDSPAEKLFWSNEQGWVSPDSPDVLVLKEEELKEFGSTRGLPIEGVLLRLDKWLESLRLTP